MAEIHPTAIVDPGAELGEGVQVGPYSIIEDDVVVGDGTWIGPHVVIRNHTTIGRHNRLYQFSSIGESPQHHGYAGEPTRLVIGDRNIIREYCTFNRGTAGHLGQTRIGDDNFILAYAHIAHDCTLGNHVTFANGASLAGHVNVGDYAILGGFTLVHQFCQVGAHCITGIGAVCFQDVPPFIVAAGNSAQPYGINAKGLHRRSFPEETITLLKRAYRLLYRCNLDLKTAIREIDRLAPGDPALSTFCEFLRRSERGVIRH
ncbi:MAG: acyl-ACP--UDP-N-acetylglucosamine O-acyltransferase [Gammaproteobacteria bacterium]|nr:acyl-ACP--UDP-N-acetylglucosamine O-acyltransferase [Gammaproteobacteria bacterium]